MPLQLTLDCLKEIFECLEEDKATLFSCLLVNRIWCRISVIILWRQIWDVSKLNDTLIACLPNESKEFLLKNGIIISTPTSKPPLFNYPSFCKILSISQIINRQIIFTGSKNHKISLMTQEILKMFMKQNSSLKELIYDLNYYEYKIMNYPKFVNFLEFPGARDYLKNISRLLCSSNVYPGFFYQLSQICHNIQSLNIECEKSIPIGLVDLINSQNNLKCFSLKRLPEYGQYDEYVSDVYTAEILPSLTNHSDTLKTLHLHGEVNYDSSSFITKFTNLQELDLSLEYENAEYFKELQYHTFPHLKSLHFNCPKVEILINFLKINGKTLNNFYVDKYDESLYFAIAKYCPNLKSLDIVVCEGESLKAIFTNCIQLESMYVELYYSGKELLEIVARYSPKNFHELNFTSYNTEILPDDYESFFTSWKDRVPLKSISFRISDVMSYSDEENEEIMEKYKSLGVIKDFNYISYYYMNMTGFLVFPLLY
ncbi:hypothetical protein C1645_815608 [Glomus cerebriforme]|uniref:F-box domain-containing protein n=1 Tax=Glomus cerebriforme TaxID=658196 RepID=A0A397TDH0_9GLOM|nr:hypothetical protein C1645_815608 [Glomus cerebriforme]